MVQSREAGAAVPVLWLTAGLGCDGDSIAMTAATQPSIEDLVAGVFPDAPAIDLHHPVLSYDTGDDYLATFHQAAAGELGDFILFVEGSVPDEALSGEGFWAAMGSDDDGEPITTCAWIDRLAPQAYAVIAVGTCAAYGGIHAMQGNPTGAMGLSDYLGWEWTSRSGQPVINLGGCPVRPDNMTWTLLVLLRQYAGGAPVVLDSERRPLALFDHTVHEGCDRGGFYEQGDFAGEFGSPRCIVKLGCWGPVADCNVAKNGWINGLGGCANVGGACNGCTMPGWPDKFEPFMDEPAGAKMSTSAVLLYGRTVRALRDITRRSMNLEPEWRRVEGPTRRPARPSDDEAFR